MPIKVTHCLPEFVEVVVIVSPVWNETGWAESEK